MKSKLLSNFSPRVFPYPFKFQPRKMVKHTQTAAEELSLFDHFMGLALKGLKTVSRKKTNNIMALRLNKYFEKSYKGL